MTATVLRADARAIPLPDASVDLIVTSPPYFALRSYTDGGEHYAGQIGAEPTPAEYIASLIDCTREWVRVLKPSGSLFVNLGDKYSGAQAQSVGGANRAGDSARTWRQTDPRRTGIPNKSLMMLPERYRIAAVDEMGLIARAVLVWSKPNGLPESVTDRVRRSHEDWVHLTKLPRYFSAVDEIREQHSPVSIARSGRNRFAPDLTQSGVGSPNTLDPGQACNPLGKLPGSVWEIATEPLKVPAELGVDHFAAFPTEWPRRIILGWSPSGICTACGEGRRPDLEVDRPAMQTARIASLAGGQVDRAAMSGGTASTTIGRNAADLNRRIVGYSCACPAPGAPTRPAVVLDPFGGTGTTALVASVLGRHGISVDMSADYCRLARWRTTDAGQRAKASRVTAPPKQLAGQSDLLDLIA